MDWASYKALCDRPDHWSRWMLDECADLLARVGETDLIAILESATESPPLAKPAGHRGPPETAMHRLNLAPEHRAQIAAAVRGAKARGLKTSRGRDLGGFDEAWQEYSGYMT